MSQGENETNTTYTDAERRRLLKMGAVGAAAAGAAVVGGPQVLGMGESAPYAGAATPPPTTAPPPPNQSSILVQVNLVDTSKPPQSVNLPASYTGIQARLYDAATDGNREAGPVSVLALEDTSNLTWSFANLTAGTYYVELEAPVKELLDELPGYSTVAPMARFSFTATTASQAFSHTTSATLS